MWYYLTGPRDIIGILGIGHFFSPLVLVQTPFDEVQEVLIALNGVFDMLEVEGFTWEHTGLVLWQTYDGYLPVVGAPTDFEQSHIDDGTRDIQIVRLSMLRRCIVSYVSVCVKQELQELTKNLEEWLDLVRSILMEFMSVVETARVLSRFHEITRSTIDGEYRGHPLTALATACDEYIRFGGTLYSFVYGLHHGITVFVSFGGKCGWAVGDVQQGDCVSLWKGIRCPVITRSVACPPDEHHCKLISISLVQGFMHGEEWKEDDLVTFVVH